MQARARFFIGLIALTFGAIACGSSGSETGEVAGSRISTEALRSACRVVCPTCAPGRLCPHHCVLDCPNHALPCGSSVCRNGDVCCNASCGICAPPGGACTQQACEPTQPCVENVLCIRGFHWSP